MCPAPRRARRPPATGTSTWSGERSSGVPSADSAMTVWEGRTPSVCGANAEGLEYGSDFSKVPVKNSLLSGRVVRSASTVAWASGDADGEVADCVGELSGLALGLVLALPPASGVGDGGGGGGSVRDTERPPLS
jgi:hypothetical protein